LARLRRKKPRAAGSDPFYISARVDLRRRHEYAFTLQRGTQPKSIMQKFL
jgi:hypothetical protein